MQLKQINSQYRIIFLKKFTKELIINSVIEEERKKRIEFEKLKQKFEDPLNFEGSFEKIGANFFQPSITKVKPLITKIKNKKIKPRKKFSLDLEQIRKPILHRMRIVRKRKIRKLKPTTKKPIIQQPPIKKPQIKVLQTIKPEPHTRPEGFNLGKIEQLLKDKRIQSIECSGPEKNILVKKNNKINTTNILINQQEITEIINRFSQQAKIPVIGGILKAAVGDLVISAIVSKFIGSRFIINRIISYSIVKR